MLGLFNYNNKNIILILDHQLLSQIQGNVLQQQNILKYT